MANHHIVYSMTKHKSWDAASKKHGSENISRGKNGRIYREVWRGSLRGKIKDYILEHAHDTMEYGDKFNGYGYADKYKEYYMTAKDAKGLLYLVEKKNEVSNVSTIEEEKKEWSKRLVSLLKDEFPNLTFDDAMEMAQEKLDYKDRLLDRMEMRQYESFSQKRASLIRKMERENPLRRIKDRSHATCILIASRRHKFSNYDQLLEHYRSEAAIGNIDKSEVKDLARQNMTNY